MRYHIVDRGKCYKKGCMEGGKMSVKTCEVKEEAVTEYQIPARKSAR